MNTIPYLAINEDDIQHAISLCEDCMSTLGVNKSGFEENFYAELEEIGSWRNVSGSIIAAYMTTTQTFIENDYPALQVEVEPNGISSQIYINGEPYTTESERGDWIKDFEIVCSDEMFPDNTISVLTFEDFRTIEDYAYVAIIGIDKGQDDSVTIKPSAAWKEFGYELNSVNSGEALNEAFYHFTGFEEEADNKAILEIKVSQNDKSKTVYVTLDEALEGASEVDDTVISRLREAAKSKIEQAKNELSMGILESEVIKNSNCPKDVLEFCGESAGAPSMVIFSHDLGVRLGYVQLPSSVAEKTIDTTDASVMPIVASYAENRWLNSLYKEQTGKDDEKGKCWVVYDCGHSGETYDEEAIRKYFPQEADEIIERNSFRNDVYGDYSPAVRSLEFCKSANATLVREASQLEKHKKPKQAEYGE